eukprot:jgi/Chlat1/3811/Chrsp26S00294
MGDEQALPALEIPAQSVEEEEPSAPELAVTCQRPPPIPLWLACTAPAGIVLLALLKYFPLFLLGLVIGGSLVLVAQVVFLYYASQPRAWQHAQQRNAKFKEPVAVSPFSPDSSSTLEREGWLHVVPGSQFTQLCEEKTGYRGERATHAMLRANVLILRSDPLTREAVLLDGCIVECVPAGPGNKRMWNKRYPVRLKHPTRALVGGEKVALVFAITGIEKEAWYVALRRASRLGGSSPLVIERDQQPLQDYAAYMWRLVQLTREVAPVESKVGSPKQSEGKEKSKIRDRLRSMRRNKSRDQLKGAKSDSFKSDKADDKTGKDPGASSSGEGLKSPLALMHNYPEVGGVAWVNLLFARIFYDMRRNENARATVHAQIQRNVRNLDLPPFISPMRVTDVQPGDLPPIATALRSLPPDPNGGVALEVDIFYQGGGAITLVTNIEAKLGDVFLLGSQKEASPQDANVSTDDASAAATSAVATASSSGSHSWSLANSLANLQTNSAVLNNLRKNVSSLVEKVATRVSALPITLNIKCTLLKGTLRISIAPPPSNRLWYGFIEPPELHLVPEPMVGELAIKYTIIANWIAEKLRHEFAESLVAPNFDDLELQVLLAAFDHSVWGGEPEPIPSDEPKKQAESSQSLPVMRSSPAELRSSMDDATLRRPASPRGVLRRSTIADIKQVMDQSTPGVPKRLGSELHATRPSLDESQPSTSVDSLTETSTYLQQPQRPPSTKAAASDNEPVGTPSSSGTPGPFSDFDGLGMDGDFSGTPLEPASSAWKGFGYKKMKDELEARRKQVGNLSKSTSALLEDHARKAFRRMGAGVQKPAPSKQE